MKLSLWLKLKCRPTHLAALLHHALLGLHLLHQVLIDCSASERNFLHICIIWRIFASVDSQLLKVAKDIIL